MARVVRFTDGDTHILGAAITTLHTICGICDDPDNHQDGDEFEGVLTCEGCKEVARNVFYSCKKSEVK